MRIEGHRLAPARYEILSTDKVAQTSIVSLTIHEGRNHQVKNMFQAIGLPVQKLKREKYGELTLAGLRPGEFRQLSRKEITSLLQQSK